MDGQKILQVVQTHKEFLAGLGAFPVRADRQTIILTVSERLSHLLWMCEEVTALVAERRIEKSMRWLGFIYPVRSRVPRGLPRG